MATLECGVVAVQQRPTRVWRGGTGGPLLLLHAAGGDAYTGWHRIWDDLARDFTVVAPDWPGFGESQAMPISQVSLVNLAGWIEDLRLAFGFEKWSIVGNSFGGTTGRLYAAQYPARVERLVLINGAGLPTPGATLPALAEILASGKVSGPEDVAREALKLMFHDPNLLTPKLLAELSAGMPTIMAILGKLSASPMPLQTMPEAPTLVLWGEGDRFAPIAVGEALAAELPKASFKSVPEAGHLPQIERPAAVVAALREFLLH